VVRGSYPNFRYKAHAVYKFKTHVLEESKMTCTKKGKFKREYMVFALVHFIKWGMNIFDVWPLQESKVLLFVHRVLDFTLISIKGV
jgi:hypothetical protein